MLSDYFVQHSSFYFKGQREIINRTFRIILKDGLCRIMKEEHVY